MDEQLFDQQLAAWLRDGPTSASSWVLDAVVNHARTHPRRTPIHVRWGFAMKAADAHRWPAPFAVRPLIALATLFVAIALGGLVYIGARGLMVAPPSPTAPTSPAPVSTSTPLGTATPASTPTPTPAPTPTPTPISTPASGPTATIGFVCPPGTDPNTPGPSDQTRPWTGAAPDGRAGPMTFDSARGLVVALNGSPLSLWQFDVCRNTWAKSRLALKSAQAPQVLVYDPTTDQLLADEGPTSADTSAAHSDTRLVSYDLETGRRTVNATVPFVVSVVHAVFRPVAGQLVVRDDAASRLWSYDVTSDSWAELGQAGDLPPALGSAALLAYDPTVDRLILYSQNAWGPGGWSPRTYEYDFGTSSWTREDARLGLVDLPFGIGRDEIAYHEALGRVVIYSYSRGISYDAAGHKWDILNLGPGSEPTVTHRTTGARSSTTR